VTLDAIGANEAELSTKKRRRQWAPIVSAACLILLVLGGAAAAGYAIYEHRHSDYCNHEQALVTSVIENYQYNASNGSSVRLPSSITREFSQNDANWLKREFRSYFPSVNIKNPAAAQSSITTQYLLHHGC
jgi:hypothetical protein